MDEQFRRELINKTLVRLSRRLIDTDDEVFAEKEMTRIERLADDSGADLAAIRRVASAIETNEALGTELRGRAIKLSAWIVTVQKKWTAKSASMSENGNPEHVNFNFSDMMVPAGTQADDLETRGWQRISGEELEGFIGQINPIDGRHYLGDSTALVHWCVLPWWQDVALIRAVDQEWIDSGLVVYFLAAKGALYRLNGTSPPIHEANAKFSIKLNESLAADYLKFFCFFVHGEAGGFYIIENADNSFLPVFPDKAAEEVVLQAARKMEFEGINEQGHFKFKAVVFYSNALFDADFSVHPTGAIEMTDDKPVSADLPVKVDASLK